MKHHTIEVHPNGVGSDRAIEVDDHAEQRRNAADGDNEMGAGSGRETSSPAIGVACAERTEKGISMHIERDGKDVTETSTLLLRGIDCQAKEPVRSVQIRALGVVDASEIRRAKKTSRGQEPGSLAREFGEGEAVN